MSDKKNVDRKGSGHRQRLIEKFDLCQGFDYKGIFDYELLELLLFFVHSRKDTKCISKLLFNKFGCLSKILSAPKQSLLEIPGIGKRSILFFNIINEILARSLQEKLKKGKRLISLNDVITYCEIRMKFLINEQLRIFFLNKNNQLIADELFQKGTVNTVPFLERSIIEKSIYFGATAIILVHNHPSGDHTPSTQDIIRTKKLIETAERLNIQILDHIIISPYGHYSMKEHKIF